MKLEEYFDEATMSIHLRENNPPYAKKGFPGNWEFVKLSPENLTQELIREISEDILSAAEYRNDAFVEISRPSSDIVQIGKFRIVITRPPFSDGWEITAVRPVRKLTLKDYNLSEKLIKRIEKQAEGILISGSPGHGKSTISAALAEFYSFKGKIVKTVEAPRDLQLNDEITQYAISHGTPEEIHDILLLTRPDYAIYDEMRNLKDFELFTDLRLAGIGFIGIVHATNPIDSIQRFIGKIELGVIPQVIDTVIFIKDGKINKVLSLEMTVKVPSGMTEADLARPIVIVKDFETEEPEFEIYTYGEQTVVIPVQEESSDPFKELAEKQIEKEFLNYTNKASARIISGNRAEIYVPEEDIKYIIGKEGKNIDKIENKLGISIDVKELRLEENKELVNYTVKETSTAVNFKTKPFYAGQPVEIYVNGHFLFESRLSKKGNLKITKKSKLGQTIMEDMSKGSKVELKV